MLAVVVEVTVVVAVSVSVEVEVVVIVVVADGYRVEVSVVLNSGYGRLYKARHYLCCYLRCRDCGSRVLLAIV